MNSTAPLLDYVPLHWAWRWFERDYKQAMIVIATHHHGKDAELLAAKNWECLPDKVRDQLYLCFTSDAIPYCRELALNNLKKGD